MNKEKPPDNFSGDVRKDTTEMMGAKWAKGWEENIEDERMAETWLDAFEHRLGKLGIEIKDSKVLEIGSGNSVFLNHLRKKGVDVIGVDARPRGKTEGLPVVAARIEQLPFPDETFGVVLSNAVFDDSVYNQDYYLMMEEICRVLKHGGVYAATLNRTEESVENLKLISSPKDGFMDSLINIFRKV